MKTIDIAAVNMGSVLSIRAATRRGEHWVNRHLGDAARYAGAVLAEHRYGPDILLGAHNDGLTVSLDGRIADAPRA